MDTVDIKYFGTIENPPHDEVYEATMYVEEGEVELDLIFYNRPQDEKWIDELTSYLDELPLIKERLEKKITSNYRDGGVVKEYIDFHIEDDPIILVDLFDDASLKSEKEQLIDALKLERINFYPEEEKYTSWCFTIGRDYTDMEIVIQTSNKGRIESIVWDS